jgi:hypothetical protein
MDSGQCLPRTPRKSHKARRITPRIPYGIPIRNRLELSLMGRTPPPPSPRMISMATPQGNAAAIQILLGNLRLIRPNKR